MTLIEDIKSTTDKIEKEVKDSKSTDDGNNENKNTDKDSVKPDVDDWDKIVTEEEQDIPEEIYRINATTGELEEEKDGS